MTYYSNMDTPVGKVYIICDDEAVYSVFIEGQQHTVPETALPGDSHPMILRVKNWLTDYFSGSKPAPDSLPLAPAGTAFQTQVWQMLLSIPYGKTVTYGDLAKRFHGRKMSAQAIGQAVGKNPISIIIPCHRVMGSGNRLTGYDGGIHKKVHLLQHEGVDIRRMIYPKC